MASSRQDAGLRQPWKRKLILEGKARAAKRLERVALLEEVHMLEEANPLRGHSGETDGGSSHVGGCGGRGIGDDGGGGSGDDQGGSGDDQGGSGDDQGGSGDDQGGSADGGVSGDDGAGHDDGSGDGGVSGDGGEGDDGGGGDGGSSVDGGDSGDGGVSSDDGGGDDGGSSDGNSSGEDDEGGVVADEDRDEYLLQSLTGWARRGVSGKKINELLKILRPIYPLFPKSYRTLLKTPRETVVKEVGNGLYWHKGILPNLNSRVDEQYLRKYGEVRIDVNMDGLPLFRNSPQHFWPILGCLVGQNDPFIIAVWFGNKSKPDDVERYLEEYVNEVGELQRDGYSAFNNVYSFAVRNYILDAPARSLVKYCIGHGGTFGCEKCTVQGVRYRNREVFTNLDAPLRTDQSYLDRENPQHHKPGVSPLETIQTGMVSQFRLDGLHLIYLGSFKRWLSFILGEEGPFRIDNDELAMVSADLLALKRFTPVEFNRKPRELKRDGNHLKATELRRILVYDGLKVFKSLDDNLYRNYLLLQAAVYIMSSVELLNDFIDVAEQLMREFVLHARRVFGRIFIVYNVHSLIHMHEECRQHGSLEEFSAFKYENFLGVLKHCLRSAYQPLQQLANRDFETSGRLTSPKQHLGERVVLSQEHRRRAGEVLEGTQYRKLQTGGITLSLNDADCCFLTKRNEVVILSNIVQSLQGNIVLVGRRFLMKEDAYQFPIRSSMIGILRVSGLEQVRRPWSVKQLRKKFYLMPDGNDSFLVIPLIHYCRT